jgi:hypothetical protein
MINRTISSRFARVAGIDKAGCTLLVAGEGSPCSGETGVGLVSHRFRKFFILFIVMVILH